jgi:Enterobacterial TraT complement resistance protein
MRPWRRTAAQIGGGLGVLLTLGSLLAGCAATVTALKHTALDVQTRLSETLFLDPVPPTQRTVWLEVNSTAEQPVDLTALRGALTARGYRVLADPEQAHYRLQVHVLYVGKAAQAAMDQALGVGFGGPLAGAVGGATAGAVLGASGRAVGIGTGIGGLLGAAAETVSGALVKAVTDTVITDVQLSEHATVPVAQQQTATRQQGTQTQVRQEVTGTSNWRRSRTRVITTATRVNLHFEDARPVLEQGLVRSLAGLLS